MDSLLPAVTWTPFYQVAYPLLLVSSTPPFPSVPSMGIEIPSLLSKGQTAVSPYPSLISWPVSPSLLQSQSPRYGSYKGTPQFLNGLSLLNRLHLAAALSVCKLSPRSQLACLLLNPKDTALFLLPDASKVLQVGRVEPPSL